MTERQHELHERLAMPHALLSRTDLAELGLPRRRVDAVFRALPVLVSGEPVLTGPSLTNPIAPVRIRA